MEEFDVPPFFICPISLQIMKDPVTVSSGITYDRQSIEEWLYSNKNTTCPVTRQPVSDSDVTPNHTLRRLIQAWCAINASYGVQRIPTPKAPITNIQIVELLHEASYPYMQVKCLRRLRSVASENETNKRSIVSAGAVEFLAGIVRNSIDAAPREGLNHGFDYSQVNDEALSLLHNLHISESRLKALAVDNGGFIETLTKIMQIGSCKSRAYAVMISKSILETNDQIQLVKTKSEFFVEIVKILKDHVSHQALKSALQSLILLCPWGRNRVKAVHAVGVPVIIELLLNSPEKKVSEMALAALDLLCGCAEGRAELLNHSGGIAVVGKKILSVSSTGSERAVRILYSISKYSATPSVVQEMLDLGVVEKLCFLLQVENGSRVKDRASQILKMHSRQWRKSPCKHLNLLSSYPC